MANAIKNFHFFGTLPLSSPVTYHDHNQPLNCYITTQQLVLQSASKGHINGSFINPHDQQSHVQFREAGQLKAN